MKISDLDVGDMIMIPVRVVNEPGSNHIRKFQRLVRAQTTRGEVVWLGEGDLKDAERFGRQIEK